MMFFFKVLNCDENLIECLLENHQSIFKKSRFALCPFLTSYWTSALTDSLHPLGCYAMVLSIWLSGDGWTYPHIAIPISKTGHFNMTKCTEWHRRLKYFLIISELCSVRHPMHREQGRFSLWDSSLVQKLLKASCIKASRQYRVPSALLWSLWINLLIY